MSVNLNLAPKFVTACVVSLILPSIAWAAGATIHTNVPVVRVKPPVITPNGLHGAATTALPKSGNSVIVDFEQGNPSRPVITGTPSLTVIGNGTSSAVRTKGKIHSTVVRPGH